MATLFKVVGFSLMAVSFLLAGFTDTKMKNVLAVGMVGAITAATGESMRRQQ